MTPEQHKHIEWECSVNYALGYMAGMAAAGKAVDEAIQQAIDPGPDVNPAGVRLNQSAKDVVRRLLDSWDRGAA